MFDDLDNLMNCRLQIT